MLSTFDETMNKDLLGTSYFIWEWNYQEKNYIPTMNHCEIPCWHSRPISGNSNAKLYCGNFVNMPYLPKRGIKFSLFFSIIILLSYLCRIQQLQLVCNPNPMTQDVQKKLWDQIESEIFLHRHKTVVRACRGQSNPQSPQHELDAKVWYVYVCEDCPVMQTAIK